MKTHILKIISLVASVLIATGVNAQIKVWPNGKVAVGFTGSQPNARLAVGGVGAATYAGYFYNSSTADQTHGIRAEIAVPSGANKGYCVNGVITSGQGYTYGIFGSSINSSPSSNGRSFGVFGQSGNASNGFNYGVYGLISGSNNGAGIVGTTSVYNPSIPGIYAAYFDGQIRTTNDAPIKPSAGSWSGASDERLKTEMTPFEDGMNIIQQINPIKYRYNGIGDLPTEKYYYGVRAQELEEVAPYTVNRMPLVVNQEEAGQFTAIGTLSPDSTGQQKSIVEALSFNYDALIYVMINALKEQQVRIDDMEELLKHCCLASPDKRVGENGSGVGKDKSNAIPTTTVELRNSNNTILYQNIPNPFDGETVVNYYLPQDVNNAKMIFHNNMGQVIKEIVLEHRSDASITLKANDLARGIYTYSLVVEGRTVDTKKMLKK